MADESTTPPAGEQGASPAQPGKTFTQEQLDAIIADRLSRERGKFADYDKLKEAATELEKIRASQMSDSEKVQAQLKALQDENSSLKSRMQTIAAENAAAKAGAMYPDLVAAKIPADALSDDKKLEEAVKSIKTQYPALFGKANGSADGGAGGKSPAGGGMNDFIRRAAGR